jgi:cytoskeletal protein RodZ
MSMVSLGKYLQKLRMDQCLTLAEISQRTKIKESYLAALESDDYAQLPGATYAKAFLRLIARELGCNADQLVRLSGDAFSVEPPAMAESKRSLQVKRQRAQDRRIPLLRASTIYWLFFTAFLCTVVIGIRFAIQQGVQPDAPPYATPNPVPADTADERGYPITTAEDAEPSGVEVTELPHLGGLETVSLSVAAPVAEEVMIDPAPTSNTPSEPDTIAMPVGNAASGATQGQLNGDTAIVPAVESLTEVPPGQAGTTVVYPGRSEATSASEEPTGSPDHIDESTNG